MIPDLVLDDEMYDDIFQEAREKVRELYPEWSDYNLHDPGITLIELFSWLKEAQQYYLDQIGEEHLKRFLKFVGVKRLCKKPAKALISLETKNNFLLPKGTKLYAGSICFETKEENYMVKDDIMTCFYARYGIVECLNKQQLKFGHKLKMYLFGKEPKEDDCFYIGITNPLRTKIELSIYMDLFEEYKVKRNPVKEESFYPLAAFEMEYYTESGWEKVENFRDKTYGMITSGQIFFTLLKTMCKVEVYGKEGYFLRFRVTKSQYDVPPILQGLSINVFETVQRDRIFQCTDWKKEDVVLEDRVSIPLRTFMEQIGRQDVYVKYGDEYQEVSVYSIHMDAEQNAPVIQFLLRDKEDYNEEMLDEVRVISYEETKENKKILGYGTGFPGQQFDLMDEYVEYETFELMVETIGKKHRFTHWKRVDDFGDSTPYDCHYVLDSRTGTITFGDCIHGMAPEGEIRMVSYARTLGAYGNVKAEKIDQLPDYFGVEARVWNIDNAEGGRGEEEIEESFARAKKEITSVKTAVTYEDYERYVMETPGLMIHSCKVIPPDKMSKINPYQKKNVITIVVNPFSSEKKRILSRSYKKNIINYLENFRMVGTKIRLLEPKYTNFSVYIEISLKPQYLGARTQVDEAVKHYFEQLSKEFGVVVSESHLYGVLDKLPCTSEVKELAIQCQGEYLSKDSNTTCLLPHGVAILDQVEYIFTMD